jgi:hypothetical protein
VAFELKFVQDVQPLRSVQAVQRRKWGQGFRPKSCLEFARDRRCYLHWCFEAKKRFGLCVLDYAVTSNHIHLLVKDTGPSVIAQSMQLIAGRTAQEYNQRKGKQGAF